MGHRARLPFYPLPLLARPGVQGRRSPEGFLRHPVPADDVRRDDLIGAGVLEGAPAPLVLCAGNHIDGRIQFLGRQRTEAAESSSQIDSPIRP